MNQFLPFKVGFVITVRLYVASNTDCSKLVRGCIRLECLAKYF
jgi:hypothetical protein